MGREGRHLADIFVADHLLLGRRVKVDAVCARGGGAAVCCCRETAASISVGRSGETSALAPAHYPLAALCGRGAAGRGALAPAHYPLAALCGRGAAWERRTAVVEVDVELLATTPDERSRNARPLWPAGRRVWVFDGVVWGGEYANAATSRAAPKRLEAAVMCGRSAGGGGGGSGGGVGRVEGSDLSGGAYVGDRGGSRQGGGRRQRGCWGALAPNHLSSRRRRRFQGSRPCC